VSRDKNARWDAEIDASLKVGEDKLVAAVNEVHKVADKLLAEGRHEVAIAIVNLIIASIEHKRTQDDVLFMTRAKARSDVARAEMRAHDGLQALKEEDFVYIPRRTHEARQKKENETRLKKARRKARLIEIASKERVGLYPSWMREKVGAYVASCARLKPSAQIALDRIMTESKERGYEGPWPSRQAVQKWIDKNLQPSTC
jgi:hypothetical protein